MKAVLVIDASRSVRETLRIILGRDYDVSLAPSLDAATPSTAPALIVLGLPPPPRDDGAAAAALAHLADVPILLLNSPGEVDLSVLAPPDRRIEFLPKPFDAYALRARVTALLTVAPSAPWPPERVEQHRGWLEYPRLSHAAAHVARRAVAVDMPVLLIGEPGTGALALARALHCCGAATGPFEVAAGRDLDADDLTRRLAGGAPARAGGGTLFVEDVCQVPPGGQRALLALLHGFAGSEASRRFRLIASTTESLDARVSDGRFAPELAYALGTLPIFLVPLRERSADIPALVERVTADLIERLRLEPVTYTAAAMDQLATYLWFGNVAELEAVVGRTLALHRPRVVEPTHLVFFPAEAARTVAPAAPSPAPRPKASGVPGEAASSLEVLLGELAHELRNPMVTIKTFAQHLDAVLSDPEARARFTALTSDAIGRMDALLETVLDFARFRAPEARATDLLSLLERALAEATDDLARKSVRVEHNGTGTMMVVADETQILFALRSLIGGIVADLQSHEPLRVAMPRPGTVELYLRTDRTTAERLTAYVAEHTSARGETPPLSLALAAALVRRNGGSLDMRRGADGTAVVTLTLPPAE